MIKKVLNRIFLILISFIFFAYDVNAQEEYDFSYSGEYQIFVAPKSGYYKLEAWGAQGGSYNATYYGGYGAYATGYIYLEENEEIYIYVGGKGSTASGVSGRANGGYNGGGAVTNSWASATSATQYRGSGGGATHFAFSEGLLSTKESNISDIILVAAGGSGIDYIINSSHYAYCVGAHGGGIEGTQSTCTSNLYPYLTSRTNATQTSPGTKVYNGYSSKASFGAGAGGTSGGGAGLYGGVGGGFSASGSSYIGVSYLTNAYMACYACTTSNETATKTIASGQASATATSDHAKSGDGHARITYIYPLASLTSDKGTLTPTFAADTFSYNLALNNDESEVTISAEALYEDSIITGTGEYTIPVGSTNIVVTVTSPEGNIITYNITATRNASSDNTLKDIKINGSSIENFNSSEINYTVQVPFNTDKITIEPILGKPNQTLTYESEVEFTTDQIEVTVFVISEDTTENKLYTIKINREETTFLKDLIINNATITFDFYPEIFTYTLDISDFIYTLPMEAIPFSENATVKIEGNKYIDKEDNLITVTVTNGDLEPTVYKINLNKIDTLSESIFDYDYTGDYATFVAPFSGIYKFESWGAQGGSYNATYYGGYGAYATGEITLLENQEIFIYVGGKGNGVLGKNASTPGGFNGGGNAVDWWASSTTATQHKGSGGGATHFAFSKNLLKDQASTQSEVILVSSGGGGSLYFKNGNGYAYCVGGHGGGISGSRAQCNSAFNAYLTSYKNATQTTAGSAIYYGGSKSGAFGAGGSGYSGGGAGWYGGVGIANVTGGGSSYIGNHYLSNKHMTCYNCTTSDAIDTKTLTNSNVSETPLSDYSKKGNGYARVSLLSVLSSNNFLDSLIINDGEIPLDFEIDKLSYDIDLSSEDSIINVQAIPKDENARVMGTGDIDIPPGDYEHKIIVTASDGTIKTYTLNINRPASSDPDPKDIEVNKMLEFSCKENAKYCNYTFDINTPKYTINLPFSNKNIEILPILKSKYQSYEIRRIEGDVVTVLETGDVTLNDGENIFEVEITSEDGQFTSLYTYHLITDITGNNNLASLEFTNPNVTIENFYKYTYEYFVTLPNTTVASDISILAEAENPDAEVDIAIPENLKLGINDIIITVTALNGNTKTYIIHAYKDYDTNVLLEKLVITNTETGDELSTTPAFDKLINTYTINVANEVTSITIDGESSSNATIEGLDTYTLKSGINTFEVTVTNGTNKNTYQINIIREKSSNPDLSNIVIDGYELSPTFDKDTTEYYIYYTGETGPFDITVTPVESTTTHRITGNILNPSKIVITSIAEDRSYKVYTIYTYKELSDNNLLKDIQVSYGSLNEEFKSDVNIYTMKVPANINTIEITGILDGETATITGNGIYSLANGENIIKLIVTSATGEENVYTITITKEANSDVTLKEVLNNQGSDVVKIEDEKLGYHYLIDVQYEVNKLEVTGIPNASTTVIVGNGIHPLNVGDTDIYLTLTAEDGTIETYIVRVVRDLSTNDDLEYLFVEEGGLSPIFNKTTIYYEVKVHNDITELTIEAIPEDKDAKVEIIGNENLEVGVPKDITVRVVAPKLNTKDYTLRVTRQAATTENLALLSLTTNRGELTPPFEPDVLNYELEVENNITDITIDAEALSEDVTVEGLGTYKLQVGKNAIPVFVVGTDGVQRDYQIVVTRKASSDASLKTLVVKGHTLSPTFTSTELNYTLTTSSTKLDFTSIVPTESDATYVVAGNENFTSDTLNIVTITVTAPDGETEGLYTIMVTKEGSKNNNLASLSVVGYELLPTFHKGVTFYAVEVENNLNSIVITATPEDTKATVAGTGLQVIKSGENYFNIVVTPEDQNATTKTYTILVTKEKSDNNYLSNLRTDVGSWDKSFVKTEDEYFITVPYENDKIEVFGAIEDANATVEGLKEYDLAVGDNLIEIVVTSESGITNTYKLNVTREAMNSAYLLDLSIKDYPLDVDFNKEIIEYYITVNSEVTELIEGDDINYTKEDENAKVVITGNTDFVVGMNEVKILVTASDNTTTMEYTLYVNRQMSTNNYLEYITVSEGELSPEFNELTLSYDVEVDSHIESIDIDAGTIDAASTITTGLGTHNLEKGNNRIEIKVKSMIGVTRTYVVNVYRKESSNNNLLKLEVFDNSNELTLTPDFSNEVFVYDISVVSGVNYVNIVANQEDADATVEGTGIKALSSGLNTFVVKVIAENGKERPFTINITKEKSTNNNVTMITPSIGAFTETFDPSIKEYTLKASDTDLFLSFEVITEDPSSIVTGHTSETIADGTNIRTITITAENGSENIYKITVIKENISEARLESLEITNYPFEFNSDTFTYNIQVSEAKRTLLASEITAIAKDEDATINLMGDLDLALGISNVYTIEVIAKDGYTTQTYTLNITRDSETHTIRSEIYEIIRDDEDEDYGIKIEPKTTLDNFIANFENDSTTLKLYDKNGDLVTESRNVYTGDVLALEIDGIRYDQIRVIVTGDTTGDGVVDVLDSSQLNSHILRRAFLESYSFKAGDLNRDTTIDVLDSSKMTMYILRKFTQMD